MFCLGTVITLRMRAIVAGDGIPYVGADTAATATLGAVTTLPVFSNGPENRSNDSDVMK